MKDKKITYLGKGLLEFPLENAQVSVKFSEVNDYSVFTPYEFGCKPRKVIIDAGHSVRVADYMHSNTGTVLYFDECVKDMIHQDRFYIVKLYLHSVSLRELEQYLDEMFQNITSLKGRK